MSQKINDKIVLFPFVGDSVGGSHIASVILIKKLKKIKIGYKVILFCSGPLEIYLKKEKIDFSYIDKNNNYKFLKFYEIVIFFLIHFFKVKKLISKNKISFVHSNDLRMHYLWSIISFFCGVKHIWHQHSPYFSRRNILFSALSYQIVTVSKFCKSSFTSSMSRRAIIVSNPFEFVNKKENIKEINNLNRKKNFLITYVGKFNEQKRFLFFIELAKKILQIKKNVIFLLVIDIPNDLKNKIRNELTNVIFIKKKRYILPYLKISNLIICPAKNEGFGRVLIEAMIAETLVLASNSGGHKEIINDGENGFLADCDSLEDFLIQFKKILKLDKDYIKKIIKKALFDASNNYSSEKYLKKFIEIYK